jgi:hypothetical protein
MTSSQELEANTILSRLGVSDILKLQVEFPNIYECLKYGELNKASKFIQEAPSLEPGLALKLPAFDISNWNTGFATTLPRNFEDNNNAFAILADVAAYTKPESETHLLNGRVPSEKGTISAFSLCRNNGITAEIMETGFSASNGGGVCEGGVLGGGSSICRSGTFGKDFFPGLKLSPSNAPLEGIRPGKRVSRSWIVASPFELEATPQNRPPTFEQNGQLPNLPSKSKCVKRARAEWNASTAE